MARIPRRKVSTFELVSLLLTGTTTTVEASLNNGKFNATHFIHLHKRRIIDCGIDSRDVIWTIKNFISYYRNAYWKLDQIL
jgi:AAA15 family ATPase/GTPase